MYWVLLLQIYKIAMFIKTYIFEKYYFPKYLHFTRLRITNHLFFGFVIIYRIQPNAPRKQSCTP